MKILLTNDDGIHAAGIRALAEALMAEHELVMVAPETQRSAASHSIMINSPLRINSITLTGLQGIDAYAVNGTPSDCVVAALCALSAAPDLVVSGINHGSNLGMEVHYSGTVAAATEGAMRGIPAMAVSLPMIDTNDFSTAAGIAAELISTLAPYRYPLLNVNVPDLAREQIKGIKYTAVSSMSYSDPLERRIDPSGKPYYWWPQRAQYPDGSDVDCDERWIREGYVTVTPLLINTTDTAALQRLKG